jgi:hypothetical protein
MAVGKPSKNGTFRIKDAGGTFRTFTCNLTTFSRKNSRDFDKVETYCTIEKSPGSNNITYSGKGIWNGDANEIDHVLEQLVTKSDVPVEYEWKPQGTVVGQPIYTGSGWVADKNIDAGTPGNVLVDFIVESVSDARNVQ